MKKKSTSINLGHTNTDPSYLILFRNKQVAMLLNNQNETFCLCIFVCVFFFLIIESLFSKENIKL